MKNGKDVGGTKILCGEAAERRPGTCISSKERKKALARNKHWTNILCAKVLFGLSERSFKELQVVHIRLDNQTV